MIVLKWNLRAHELGRGGMVSHMVIDEAELGEVATLDRLRWYGVMVEL
jgi:hypothetical protein